MTPEQLLEILKTQRPDILLAYLNEKGDFMSWVESNIEQVTKDKEEADLQKTIDAGKVAEIKIVELTR